MASVATYLSVDRFEELYDEKKPCYEYWFGQAVQKTMPTALHGIIQILLGSMLMAGGWKVASEVKLKISAFAQPLMNLIADLDFIELPYPTKPFALCIEILSPADHLSSVFQKMRALSGLGHSECLDN